MLFEYETERLILRVLKPENANQVLDFFLADKEYFEFYEPDRAPNFYTENHQKSLLRYEYNLAMNSQVIRYYISFKEDPDRIIGTICLHDITPSIYSCCELGYKFLRSVQHQGVASEAIQCLIPAIFSELHLHRITAMIEPDNKQSISFAERNGFIREGLCQDYAYIHGEWRSYYLYAMLPPSTSQK